MVNIKQILDKYLQILGKSCVNILNVLWKFNANIVQKMSNYKANILQILVNIGHLLDQYWAIIG